MFKQQPANSRTKKQRRLKERKEFSAKEQTKIQTNQPTNQQAVQATTSPHSDPKQRILKRKKKVFRQKTIYELIYMYSASKDSQLISTKKKRLNGWLTSKVKYKKVNNER